MLWKDINEEKEIELGKISKECERLKSTLDEIESKQHHQSMSLDDELGANSSKIFPCEECDDKFVCRQDVKHHRRSIHGKGNSIDKMKLKLSEISKQLSDQKLCWNCVMLAITGLITSLAFEPPSVEGGLLGGGFEITMMFSWQT